MFENRAHVFCGQLISGFATGALEVTFRIQVLHITLLNIYYNKLFLKQYAIVHSI